MTSGTTILHTHRDLDGHQLDRIATRAWVTPRRAGALVVGEPSPTPELRLSLLGNWRLTIDGDAVSMPSGARRLLARLALCGRQARIHLAGTLWDDDRLDDERALGRLRTLLWRLHSTTDEDTMRQLLVATDGHLSLGPDVRVDAAELAALARHWSEPDDVLDARAAAEATKRLDAPELLPGWYDDWVLVERDRLAQLRVQALEHLAITLVTLRRPNQALDAARAAIRTDPLRESAHRAAMRAHLAADNPASALRQFETYQALLRSELGIDHPSEAIRGLVASILSRH